jgi:hypothetical protein
MSDGIMITIGDDGEATLYDDTYDITIHCESKEEQDEVRKALENIPHWIPCSERLPEESGCYLVSVKNDHERRYSKTSWFGKDGWFARQDVIAWMPLPEEYRGE